ncbi:hypothetical protein BDP27DRAFT_1450703 [Rhodocollybia butyracea]|uniref:Uncharacterized protein n=1 Tax=Rhodocollybia butyracea TaxID=206335 RepID=A0A9P5PFY2_9AGAR|nr:hypothetical protein BDP27DRAFT_1450703 [Rhodocollybia butyracea]
MRSTTTLLLFALLASSILVVLPAPVQEVTARTGHWAGTSSQPGVFKNLNKKRPLLDSTDGPAFRKKLIREVHTVVLINRMGEKNLNVEPSVEDRRTISTAINEAFNILSVKRLAPKYKGLYLPDTDRRWGEKANLRRWIYFELHNHKLCPKCFGWIAKGDSFVMRDGISIRRPLTPEFPGRLYAGISPGKPTYKGFTGVQGLPFRIPVKEPERDPLVTVDMQREWFVLLAELNERLMAQPPSSVDTVPSLQPEIATSNNPDSFNVSNILDIK